MEISIHAPLTGSDASSQYRKAPSIISIHAPLTGSDEKYLLSTFRLHGFQSTLPLRGATSRDFARKHRGIYFNPRSPYGERPATSRHTFSVPGFQSTLPLRGATWDTGQSANGQLFQSTLPLRGATWPHQTAIAPHAISIHAPLTGSDRQWLSLIHI